MNPLRRIAIAICGLALCAGGALAIDSSDLFLRAYQEFQAGEKSERDNDLRDALTHYQNAEKMLAQITREEPTWQPPVVEYRLKRTRDNIQRLASDVAKLPAVPAGPEGPLPKAAPDAQLSLPAVNTSRPLAPGRDTGSATADLPPVATGAGAVAASGDVNALRRQIARLQRDNDDLQQKITRQAAELTSARFEIDRTKVTVVELKAQLAQAQSAVEDAAKDREITKPKPEPPKEDPRVKELGDRITQLEADNEVLTDENARLMAKLDTAAKYIEASDKARKTLTDDRAKIAAQRDEAVAKAKRIKDNAEVLAKLKEEKKQLEQKLADATDSGKLAKLAAENKDLAARLEDTQQKLDEALKKPEEFQKQAEQLRSEMNSLNDRLLEAYAQTTSRDEQIKTLAKQLDDATGDLARLKLNPSPSADDKKLMVENDTLRAIILRQIKEQAERDAAREALQAELQKLQVKSDTITAKIDVLSKPSVRLTDTEQQLFREPIALVTENTPATMDVTLAVAKPGESPSPTPAPQGAEALPPATRDMVEEAKKLFETGKFNDAERLYQRIVDEAPDNSFALSNLGVTQIQSRKLSAAEVALKKAVSINPQDSFAATNLGIVYCKQGRFDEAIDTLTAVIAADDTDHVAHNYLGVSLGEKGRKAEAEAQLKRAVELKSDYADGHFNLAVLYATSTPPAVELAREHYKKAVSAGAPADPSLERLLQ